MKSRAASESGCKLCLAAVITAALVAACSRPPATPAAHQASARNLLLITIDTMRADHVGAYGYRGARTPTLDRLGREGVRFDRAFAPAPITLTSHASLLTGLYPPGHGARDNGMAMREDVPTLAAALRDRGFGTAAFVAAFPLDKRFGLARGFDVYSDRMPRGQDGRLANERPARVVVDQALAWLATERTGKGIARPFFLWVHFFEPHAPYGDPVRDRGRSPIERYDDEIATADREAGRLIASLGADLNSTLVVAASDHGEAFGEHGETGHSLFVYDTTLRVALLIRGPGVPAARIVPDPVGLVDVAPTVLRLLGLPCGAPPQPCGSFVDGIDLRLALDGKALPPRRLYAESFAPLLDFGWSPLRSLRDGRWKAIAAPRPELFDVEADAGEVTDLAGSAGADRPATAPPAPPLRDLLVRIDRYSGTELPAPRGPGGQSGRGASDPRARLAALGYVQGGGPASGPRPDPKDRRVLAARVAAITSGELQGDALLIALRAVVEEDPHNGQMQLRLGDTLAASGRYGEAEHHFASAIGAGVPSADPYLGLALCQTNVGKTGSALAILRASLSVEPGNPVVLANLGLLLGKQGRVEDATSAFRQALAIDPDFHEARFNLALALARAGRQAAARTEAEELLARLSPDAPQRREVERLLGALR
jgi:arylsulfatase A-like enzyme